MRKNAAVARLLEDYADILEAQDDQYRPRSYRRAAQNIRDYPEAVEDLVADGPEAVQEIEGVGESIADKVVEFVETGEIQTIEEAKAEFPVDMRELTRVEGVGPKTVGALYEELGITTLEELEAAAHGQEIREIKGFGPKTEENILKHIEFAKESRKRELLGDARPIADDLVEYLTDSDVVDQCAPAGSLRRWRETIGDIDVLAAGDDHEAVVDRFTGWEGVSDVIEAGTTKVSIRANGMRVDLRIVDPEEWGSALQYFTGSKDHNVRLRTYAIKRDLKINEYGLFDVSEIDDPDSGQRVGDRIAGETEEEIYEALDLPWIPPELREDNGEIDAAAAGDLPTLLEVNELRGDLHVHTNWSDGDNTIEEMLVGAAEFGHDYLCISDHAAGPGVVGGTGLDEADLRQQLEAIESLRDDAPITVFSGVETNISTDGEISIEDDVLGDLDIVIASPHSGLDGDGTDRLIAAIEHPHVDILGHPSGRLINQRPGLEFDIESVASAAADHGVALEVNANPHRLDLWGEAVRTAIDAGAVISINTDAHGPPEFDHLRFGVHTARRGWAEADDVINTLSADDLQSFVK